MADLNFPTPVTFADPDEEITQPAPSQSMTELAKQWAEEFAEIATSERPTKRIRPVRVE